MEKSNSRRKFIRNTALAAGGFFIVPRHVLGGKGYIAPSDKLNIAGIGVGGKGASDLAEFAKSPKVNIVALCKRTTSMPALFLLPTILMRWPRWLPCSWVSTYILKNRLHMIFMKPEY